MEKTLLSNENTDTELDRFSDFFQEKEEVKIKTTKKSHNAPWHSGHGKIQEVISENFEPDVVNHKLSSQEISQDNKEENNKLKSNKLNEEVLVDKNISTNTPSTLTNEIISLFNVKIFGKNRNILKLFLISMILISVIKYSYTTYASLRDKTSPVVQSAMVEDSSRLESIDSEYQRLVKYMVSNISPDGFNVKGNFKVEKSDGVLIVASKNEPCWYFGAVKSKIFEPRLDKSGEKCLLVEP